MFSSIILSAALLSASTLAAPINSSPSPSSTTSPSSSSSSSGTTATLLPLYVNGIDVSKTTFTAAQNLSSTFTPSQPSSPTPPDTFTHIESSTNITIVRQEAAAPLFHIPSADAQFFAAFANASFIQQQTSGNHADGDSLPNDKLDIGAKLVGEVAGGDHTVHVTVVRDPMTATGPFTWQAGGVVVRALEAWSREWAPGSFVGCAGVLVRSGDDSVAQGNFCGMSA